MTDIGLTRHEAADLGTRLEALCENLSLKERDFLESALRLAAADAWAHRGTPAGSGIRDLVLDIHLASATDSISLNPLPIPLTPKGQPE
jgi:hypothetical protein